MKLKILAIVALGVIGIGAAFVAVGGLPASASTASRFLTSAATTGDVTDDVAASGTVATTASYGLSFGAAPHLAGAAADGGSTTWTVSKLEVAVGDTVKKGEVLATADTTELKRQLADATDAWRVARIQQTIAEEALADASGTDPVRQATMNLYNAKTQVSNAQATRSQLAEQLAAGTLKAPIAGIVTAVNIVEGLDAPSGDAIVIDSTGLQVTAQVVESDLAKIVVGQAASVAIGAVGADVTGTVTSIAPTATTSNSSNGVVSYAATIVLTDPPAAVRAGMTADVTITVANASNVLTVPAAALRGSAGNYTVLLLDAAGQPVAQPVTVGLVTASLAEIKSGLTEGQEVVTGVNTAQNQATNTNNGGGGFTRGFGGGGFGGGGGNGPKIVTGP
jgi:macrolide-specific efflux system membrane fusion protein